MASAEETIRKGDQARNILEDSLYQEAWEAVRELLVGNLEDTNYREKDEREAIYQHLRSMKAVKQMLEQYMRNGEIEVKRRSAEVPTVKRVQEL